MTIEELDAIYRDAKWLIVKRSSWAAAKTIVFGDESLEKTIGEIAEMYALGPSEFRVLRPSIAEDVHHGASKTVRTVAAAGVAASIEAPKVVKAAKAARKAGRVVKSLKTVVTHGPKAAQTFANTGRLIGKANPWALALTAAWTVGSTGWFAHHAYRFNKAAYELKKQQLCADVVDASSVHRVSSGE